MLRDRNKGRAFSVEDLDDLGEIGERAGQPVDFVDDDRVDPTRRDVGKQLLQSGPIQRRAGEPAIVISRAQARPAFVPPWGFPIGLGVPIRPRLSHRIRFSVTLAKEYKWGAYVEKLGFAGIGRYTAAHT